MLRGCLESIAEGSAWPASVIVVDQGSDTSVGTWIDEGRSTGMSVEHIRSMEKGAAAARNRGFERVKTRFVAATDDDCLVAPDWVARMAAFLRANPEMIVTGRVEPGGTSEVPSVATSRVPRIYTRPLLRRDVLLTGNMGIATAVVEHIGLLDESPSLRDAAEDKEWQYRAQCLGVAIAYAPDIVVTHLGWRDAAQREVTYRLYALGQGAFYGKYIRRADCFIALRAITGLLRSPWWWLRGALTGNPELTALGRAYMSHLLPGLLAGWREGKKGHRHPS